MARTAKSTVEKAAVNTQDNQEQAGKAAGGENTAVNTQDSQEQAENAAGGENTAETKEAAENGNDEAEKETFIYIGPTVRGGALKSNAALTGSREDVKGYLKGILEAIPQVERLLVPVSRLAESKGRVKEKGTLLNKYYNEVASLDNAKKEG